jgi:hypothetical protein
VVAAALSVCRPVNVYAGDHRRGSPAHVNQLAVVGV